MPRNLDMLLILCEGHGVCVSACGCVGRCVGGGIWPSLLLGFVFYFLLFVCFKQNLHLLFKEKSLKFFFFF